MSWNEWQRTEDETGGIRISGERFPSRRSTISSVRGMVACEHPLAAEVGIRVLSEGGNAVDAAVAATATLNVVAPAASGIGGDAFALIRLAKTGEVLALNASGRAGGAASLDYFSSRNISEVPVTGMLPVTVPGAVDGWQTMLEAHGTMSLQRVLEHAIYYAEHGFPVGEIVARNWRNSVEKLMKNSNAANTYLVDGRAPHSGEIFRQPNLAHTLKLIAEGGSDVVYKGEIAEKIAKCSVDEGGLIGIDDLAHHTSTWDVPIKSEYRGHEIYECPPNGQGLAVLLALNMLSGYELHNMKHNTGEHLHLIVEAYKLAVSDAHHYVSDPEFANIPLDEILSEQYSYERRKLIRMDKAASVVEPGISTKGNDTAFVTVVDEDRNAVSLISSLYMGFGSGVVVGDTGICLHNRGNLFSLDPEHRNCIEPHKRPFHTIIPGIALREGALFASFGVTGGPMQPQAHVQLISNLLDFDMLPQEAIDAPRCRYVMEDDEVYLEMGIDATATRELKDRGHNTVSFDKIGIGFGAAQMIIQSHDYGSLLGASDPRKDGCAIGY